MANSTAPVFSLVSGGYLGLLHHDPMATASSLDLCSSWPVPFNSVWAPTYGTQAAALREFATEHATPRSVAVVMVGWWEHATPSVSQEYFQALQELCSRSVAVIVLTAPLRHVACGMLRSIPPCCRRSTCSAVASPDSASIISLCRSIAAGETDLDRWGAPQMTARNVQMRAWAAANPSCAAVIDFDALAAMEGAPSPIQNDGHFGVRPHTEAYTWHSGSVAQQMSQRPLCAHHSAASSMQRQRNSSPSNSYGNPQLVSGPRTAGH